MQRSRFLVLSGGLAALVAAGPGFAAVALAADPVVVVRPGDTLTGISRRNGVPIHRLVELNSIGNPNRIFVGQQLRTGLEPASPPRAAAPTPTAAARVHVVRRGENLTTIARFYGVSSGAIATANRLSNPSRIYGGQRLTIPGASSGPVTAPAQPAAPAPRVHVVRRGENLTTIARFYGVSIDAIANANRLRNPSRIYGGQRLTIPGAAAAARPPSSAASKPPAMPPSMAMLVRSRDAVRQVIVEEAARYRVPAALALAVAWHESGWRQAVVSHAGAVGVMQLLPATGAWVGEVMLGSPVNIDDTRQNVRAGVRLLAHYLERYAGNRDLVLAAYYQGQTAADRHGVYRMSRPYIASIRALERLFGG